MTITTSGAHEREALQWLYRQGPKHRAPAASVPRRHLHHLHFMTRDRHPRRVSFYREGYGITEAGIKFLAAPRQENSRPAITPDADDRQLRLI